MRSPHAKPTMSDEPINPAPAKPGELNPKPMPARKVEKPAKPRKTERRRRGRKG